MCANFRRGMSRSVVSVAVRGLEEGGGGDGLMEDMDAPIPVAPMVAERGTLIMTEGTLIRWRGVEAALIGMGMGRGRAVP